MEVLNRNLDGISVFFNSTSMLVLPVTLAPCYGMVYIVTLYTPYLKVHGVAINALNSTGIFSSVQPMVQ